MLVLCCCSDFSLVVASRGYSPSQFVGFPFLLWSTDSRTRGLNSCSSQALDLVSCSLNWHMHNIRITATTIQTQNISIIPKSSLMRLCSWFPPLSGWSGNHWSVPYPYSFVFSGMSYKRTPTTNRIFFWFLSLNAFVIHPFWCMYQCFVLFCFIAKYYFISLH